MDEAVADALPVRTTMFERSTPIAQLEMWAAKQPDRLLINCGGQERSYARMVEIADRLAAGLRHAGAGPGSRVAFLTASRIEMVDFVFGCARAGVIQVPLNTYLKGEFLRHQLRDCGAVGIVVDAPGLVTITPLLPDLPDVQFVVNLDDDSFAPFGNAQPPAEPYVATPDDVLALMYTSGTTGLPKGCILTHGYYVHAGHVMRTGWEIRHDDTMITAFPLFHLSGQANALMSTLTGGLSLYIETAFSASGFMARAAQVGATVTMGVGAMALAIAAQPETEDDANHPLRFASWIPLPEGVQHALEQRFNLVVSSEAYGQTECAPVAITAPSAPRKRETCGAAAPGLEVRIVDAEDREVPRGEVGEIVVRPLEPDSLFSGYWNNPSATVAAFRNLWHHTGDAGRMDAEGFLTFVDRTKDAMRRRGENVSSLQVEAAIVKHPGIAEVAVHAVPSPATEDDIKACIVPAPGAQLTPAELFDFFADTLPFFAVPRYVELVDALPKNAMNRVLKHQLRDLGVTAATWDFDAMGLTVAAGARR
jgi:crotonobetaine/carnitine-CoA ligase